MRASSFLIVTSVLLFQGVQSAPIGNISLSDKCSDNEVHISQPALPNLVPWNTVDVLSHSNYSLDGGEQNSFDGGDVDDLDNFVGCGDVDVTNTDAAPLCSPPANEATIQLVKKFQPFSANIVRNVRGLPTIGFGHRCSQPNCPEARTIPISLDTAVQLLNNDLTAAIRRVGSIVSNNVQLTDNQIGALASLSYTVGLRELQNSELIAQLNAGNLDMVEMLFLSIMGRHGVNVNLAVQTARRKAEAALFQAQSQVTAHPLPAECQVQLQSTPLNASLL